LPSSSNFISNPEETPKFLNQDQHLSNPMRKFCFAARVSLLFCACWKWWQVSHTKK
jgi:hypothetical protein